jgi:integrase
MVVTWRLSNSLNMPKIALTAGRIAKASCPAGLPQTFLWDDEAKGLGLRVTSAGAKAFIHQGKLNGRSVRITIGSPDAWPIESQWGKDADGKRVEIRRGAREEARRLQGLMDQGMDPRLQKEEQRAKVEAARTESKRLTLTLGEVWPVYLEARKAKWSERSYQDHVRLAAAGGEKHKRGKGERMAGPLAALMPALLPELTANRIAEWLKTESKTRPTNAAQCYRLLRAFIRWAADMPEYRGLIASGVYSARVVRDAVPKNQVKEGDCLQREQLPAWFDAVRKIGSPVISAYLQALLLTGARREEMAGLRWCDVDFQWRGLTIRDKVEGTRVIPLTPYLSSLLLNLKRINETPPPRKMKGQDDAQDDWKPSEWVFFSKTAATGRIQEPRIAHTKALAVAGLPHVSLHGLRRSFGTLCEWVEMPSGISAQIMGHKPSALAEKHYRRRPLDLLRKWHDAIEAWILEQACIEFVPVQADLRVVTA